MMTWHLLWLSKNWGLHWCGFGSRRLDLSHQVVLLQVAAKLEIIYALLKADEDVV